ncbi:hypothetical protein WJ06_10385 [Burkholderia cepacia]|nr:hypothetical protein WJ06_10385 [Burkholderia cepacia]
MLIGSQAGLNLTTGGDNVVVGGNQSGVASSCITTGNANIQIGSNACVASPTGTGQLSIQNILYGTANTGSGSNVSTGAIGIGVQVPQARLHVKGTDTSSATNAFAVTDSSGNTLFSVNDAGGVRMGYVADFTAQGGNIANTSLYSVPTNGFYCMSAHAAVTTAATTSSTLPAVTFYWTDADSGAVQLYTSSTNTGNSTGTYTQTGQVCFYAKGGTTINYQTSGYASSGATAMQYALHVRSYFGGN